MYRSHVLVCGGTGCTSSGSQQIIDKLQAEIDKNGLSNFKFIPCIQENCRTRMLEGDEKDGVLNYMRGISPNVYIDNEGCIELY